MHSDESVSVPDMSQRSQDDLNTIKELLVSSENSIRNEMNFLKYYDSEIKNQNKIEFKCLENNGGLFKLILTVYATYEFAVKRMLVYTLEIIDKENIKVNDLEVNLKALYFREGIEDLRKKITNSNPLSKEYISGKIVKIYKHLAETENFEANENMIITNSNLKYDTFCEIISYFEFEERNFEKYKAFVESLVHHRNNVAHGNIGFIDTIPSRMFPIKYDNYEIICEKIIELLKDLFHCIEEYILGNKYKI